MKRILITLLLMFSYGSVFGHAGTCNYYKSCPPGGGCYYTDGQLCYDDRIQNGGGDTDASGNYDDYAANDNIFHDDPYNHDCVVCTRQTNENWPTWEPPENCCRCFRYCSDTGTSADYYGDNCSEVYNPSQLDTDNDGVGDACDNCPHVFNPDQRNSGGSADGDACDTGTHNDYDNDGITDGYDWGYFSSCAGGFKIYPFERAGNDYFAAYCGSDSRIEIREFDSNGTPGEIVFQTDWSYTYYDLNFFKVENGGNNYYFMMLHQKSSGKTNVYNITSGINTNNLVYNSTTWSTDGTATTIYTNQGTFQVRYQPNYSATNGRGWVHKVNYDSSTDTISFTTTYSPTSWSKDWELRTYYDTNDDKAYVQFFNTSTGRIVVQRLYDNGTTFYSSIYDNSDWNGIIFNPFETDNGWFDSVTYPNFTDYYFANDNCKIEYGNDYLGDFLMDPTEVTTTYHNYNVVNYTMDVTASNKQAFQFLYKTPNKIAVRTISDDGTTITQKYINF